MDQESQKHQYIELFNSEYYGIFAYFHSVKVEPFFFIVLYRAFCI